MAPNSLPHQRASDRLYFRIRRAPNARRVSFNRGLAHRTKTSPKPLVLALKGLAPNRLPFVYQAPQRLSAIEPGLASCNELRAKTY